mmetsp:Transcript_23937/g.47174  ORF Transcript_23937/g.47174 Transcript_23937/m.47174 type:complete len:1048 (+) Transcript_23937:56-3199(+)|eukprot:CAMPEP_0175136322 /NCGR_PEP_ID=MMETSP0087-20121206/9215_1 /TAXON_ID=136419 /ORGANISM="Unknown Unknown, Strain D1" /LENGTH=1047 /DNA_ID=CAMNT_0016419073 /DNA_START=53 /DNA_END=3196 /DNA_ORIENTATION=-
MRSTLLLFIGSVAAVSWTPLSSSWCFVGSTVSYTGNASRTCSSKSDCEAKCTSSATCVGYAFAAGGGVVGESGTACSVNSAWTTYIKGTPIAYVNATVDCDFEAGFCGWLKSVDHLSMLRYQGSTPSFNTGATAAYQGDVFVYAEATLQNLQSFDLVSQVVPMKGMYSTCNVSFAYHMYGTAMGSLKLLEVGQAHEATLFNRSGDAGNAWFPVTVPVSRLDASALRFRFLAVTGPGYQSDICLDDIKLTCQLKPNFVCPLFVGWCGWSESFSLAPAAVQWKQMASVSTREGTLPATDGVNVLAVPELSAVNQGMQGLPAYVQADLFVPSGKSCVFWRYVAFGKVSTTLALEVRNLGTAGVVYGTVHSSSGSNQSAWASATADLTTHAGSTVRLRFSAHAGVAVSDFRLLQCGVTFAPTAAPTAKPLPVGDTVTCSFEGDFCKWQTPLGMRSFVNWAGETPSYYTGPLAAVHGSRYVYAEASHQFGQTYAMQTQVVLPSYTNNSVCLSVWYHMYGNDMGSLLISVASSPGNWTQLFSRSGQQNSAGMWLQGEVDLTAWANTLVTIKLQANIGMSYLSDIGLDHIQLKPCPLPSEDKFACSFDVDLCQWANSNRQAMWSVITGPTASFNTGPDSAIQGKGYLYAEASGMPSSSYRMDATSNIQPELSCLQFWYHMKGKTMGTLRVFASNATAPQLTQIFLRNTANTGWQMSRIDLSRFGRKGISLRFEAIIGTSYLSDIAVDNIAMRPCTPTDKPTDIGTTTSSSVVSGALALVSPTPVSSTGNYVVIWTLVLVGVMLCVFLILIMVCCPSCPRFFVKLVCPCLGREYDESGSGQPRWGAGGLFGGARVIAVGEAVSSDEEDAAGAVRVGAPLQHKKVALGSGKKRLSVPDFDPPSYNTAELNDDYEEELLPTFAASMLHRPATPNIEVGAEHGHGRPQQGLPRRASAFLTPLQEGVQSVANSVLPGQMMSPSVPMRVEEPPLPPLLPGQMGNDSISEGLPMVPPRPREPRSPAERASPPPPPPPQPQRPQLRRLNSNLSNSVASSPSG